MVAFVSSHPSWNGLPVNINGVTDNLGNNWHLLTGPTQYSGNTFTLLSAIYYVNSPATSATHTVTAQLSNPAPLVLHVVAVSASDVTGPPIFSAITNPAGPSSNVTSAPISVPVDSLLLSWAKNETSASATALNGYTLDTESTSFLWAESKTPISAGSFTGNFQYDSAIGWQTAIVGVKPRIPPPPTPVIGQLERIASLAFEHPNLEAVIVLPERDHEQIERIIKLCERYRVRWRVMPRVAESMALTVEMVGAIPLIGPPGSNIEGLNCLIKRGFDVVVATLMLLVASPIMLLAAIAIWLTDGSPLLFRQTRVGIHGKPFELLKFRTMRTQSSDTVHREYVKEWIQRNAPERSDVGGAKIYKIGSDSRITPVGRWLRRFSLDELPQLFNVLYGNMSLIGPRPAMPYELELYQEWHRHRLDAPPGITGLWQVSGRNRLSFEEMVQLDIEYIEEWSLVSDMGILLRTLPAMLQGSGM